jgi:hypothetical protein
VLLLLLCNNTSYALASSSSDQTDKELKDKDIKQKSKSSDTKPSNQQNNTKVTQAEGEEEHESNGDTGGRGLKQNITIDDTHPSDNVLFELPLDNTLPFP